MLLLVIIKRRIVMKRYYKSEEINTKNHFLVNTIWPVAGSKKGDEYRIEMHDKGFTCECKGFMYNSKCRHTKEVVKSITNEYNGRRINT